MDIYIYIYVYIYANINGPFRYLKLRYVNVAFFRPYECWGYSLKNRPET
jgi:hypothetical protein